MTPLFDYIVGGTIIMNTASKMFDFMLNKACAMKKTFIMVVIPLLLLSITVAVSNYKKNSKSIEVQPNATITTLINSSSTRSFINHKIDSKTIDLIIKCGIKAPSAMNQQPWHFCVIQNRKIIAKINSEAASDSQQDDAAKKPASRKNHLFSHAPVVIVVSATSGSQYAMFDTALACENMLIAAQSLGLGTRIITAPIAILNGSKAAEYHQLLKIPNDKKPVAALLLGVPDYSPDAIGRATSRNSNVVSQIK
jgi:nitroreductase